MRVGQGVDSHRFGGDAPLILGGVLLDAAPGVVATSDGDVAVHAVIDAILGAAALGDLGSLFPSDDPQWSNASSIDTLLPAAIDALTNSGWKVTSVDCTVIAESVRVSTHRQEMQLRLAARLGLEPSDVSVKATTTDGMGFTGRGEGIVAMAAAVIARIDS